MLSQKIIRQSRTQCQNNRALQADGQGMGSQGMSATGGGGLARVPNLRVCKHQVLGWHMQGGKDELTSCRGIV